MTWVKSVVCIWLLLAWSPSLRAQSTSDAEEQLLSQPLKQVRPLQEYVEQAGHPWHGVNALWWTQLRNGLEAVFRSEPEPWGSQAEIGGYRVARWLGLDFVPPTVYRSLHRSEWPGEASDWPFSNSMRTGSLQVYLPARPAQAEDLQDMDPLEQADRMVLSFLMGRYDTSPGNTLIDTAGKAWMVDFEDSLEIQQVRYGQLPFVRRGQRRPDLSSASGSFPFDQPQPVGGSLAVSNLPLSAWWAGEVPGESLRWVVWDHWLWIQVSGVVSGLEPAFTSEYRPQTMQRLGLLDARTLRELLPNPFTQEHIRAILERKAQLLEHYQSSLKK